MAIMKIVVGTKEFLPFSDPVGLTDLAIWRLEDATIAPMYRPTIEHAATPNKPKTNVNSSLQVRVPIVRTVDGRQLADNTVIASAKLTSLQVLPSDESIVLAIDALIAALIARKAAMVSGKTKTV